MFEETRLVVRSGENSEKHEELSSVIIRISASVCQLLSKFSAPISQILLDEGLDCGEYQIIIRPDLQVHQFSPVIFCMLLFLT